MRAGPPGVRGTPLENTLGYQFSDPALLAMALRHSSAADGDGGDNQRLEFVGDRVLGMVIAHRLFRDYPDATEGELHRRQEALVKRKACADAARTADLGPHLRLSAGEEKTGGRDKESILADAMEAVIAAVYLDGGLAAARSLVERLWRKQLDNATAPAADPKSRLQEWSQDRGRGLPDYRLLASEEDGFEAAARIPPDLEATGAGSTRRAAERAAAQRLLDRLAETGNT